jgi:hypothetical protein
MSWDDYVLLATEEIILAGAGSPPVARRLQIALEDLRAIALPERTAIIDRQLEALAATRDVRGSEAGYPAVPR